MLSDDESVAVDGRWAPRTPDDAARRRAKDETDFAATLPFLDARRRIWLRRALERTCPGHAWTALV